MSSVNKVWLCLTDLHGILRGKLIPLPTRSLSNIQNLQTEFSGPFINDINDRPIPDLKKAEKSVNYIAIPSSGGVQSPWDPTEVYYMCNAYIDEDCEIQSKLCPRTLLTNAVREFEQLGYRMKTGVELEFSLLKDDKPVLGSLQTYSMLHYENKDIQEFFSRLIDKTSGFPVTLETLHAESGNSIFETALSPADPLRVTDAAQLYRMTIRRLAKEYSMKATFASKPFPESAGVGMHVHISLNLLEGSPAKDILFSSFLAGMLYHMKTSSVLMLPVANSFQRLNTGEFWTSNAISYGIDSRSDAIRLVHHNSTSGSARIELRVPGGDCNPYLVLYYCIKAGMYGIEKEMTLDDLGKPGEKIDTLPKTLREAAMIFMESGSRARELYGDPFVDHYGQQRLHEANISTPRPEKWEKDTF